MMVYHILFIDEQEASHRNFKKNFIDSNKERFTGEYVYPEADIENMIEVIWEKNPDAILTDYSLNDYKSEMVDYEIGYTGGELASEIQARRKDYPVFITTSYGSDAAIDGADVKIIYEKGNSFGDSKKEEKTDEQHLTFSERLYYEIKAYKQKIEAWSSEFDELFEKKEKKSLAINEEERLILLDGLLEKALDQRSKLPDNFKVTSNSEKLVELIKLTRQLIGEK